MRTQGLEETDFFYSFAIFQVNDFRPSTKEGFLLNNQMKNVILMAIVIFSKKKEMTVWRKLSLTLYIIYLLYIFLILTQIL